MPSNLPTVTARGDLSLVPDALVTTSVHDVIIDEFVLLLYDAYPSSHWKFPKFYINT